jgi:hypothetical protein
MLKKQFRFNVNRKGSSTINIFDHEKHEEILDSFDEIFKRHYYTDNGPLLKKTCEIFSNFTTFEYIHCISSVDIGWLVILDSLEINKKKTNLFFEPSNAFQRSLKWYEDVLVDNQNLVEKVFEDRYYKSDSDSGEIIVCGKFIDQNQVAIFEKYLLSQSKPECIIIESHNELIKNFLKKFLSDYDIIQIIDLDTIKGFYTDGSTIISSNSPKLSDKIISVMESMNARLSEAQAAFILQSLKFFL